MTRVEYDPLRLANEIEAALAKYGSVSDHRMCKAIHFFEGELRLIAECLRCAGPQNPEADGRGIDWPVVRAGGQFGVPGKVRRIVSGNTSTGGTLSPPSPP